MKKTIYLHIGTEKTGTKSIQKFCAENTSFLEENGIFYPYYTDKKYMHVRTHWPVAAALADNKNWIPEDKRFSPEEVYSELLEDIEKKSVPNVLLSAEPFAVHVVKKKQIAQIKKLFKDHTVKIIVYLRRQDELFLSTLSTMVKSGWYVKKIDYTDCFRHEERYDYEKLLKRWADVFGKENIIVRVYRQDVLKERCIVTDFLDIFGLHTEEENEQSFHENTSFSVEAFHYKNLLNCVTEQNQKLTGAQQNKINAVLENFNLGNSIDTLLSVYDRYEIVNFFAKSNRAAAERYNLIGNNGLFEKIAKREDLFLPEEKNLDVPTAVLLTFLLFKKDGPLLYDMLFGLLTVLEDGGKKDERLRKILLPAFARVFPFEVVDILREYVRIDSLGPGMKRKFFDRFNMLFRLNKNNVDNVILDRSEGIKEMAVNDDGTIDLVCGGGVANVTLRPVRLNIDSVTFILLQLNVDQNTDISCYYQVRGTSAFTSSNMITKHAVKGNNMLLFVLYHPKFNGLIQVGFGDKKRNIKIKEVAVSSNSKSYIELVEENKLLRNDSNINNDIGSWV